MVRSSCPFISDVLLYRNLQKTLFCDNFLDILVIKYELAKVSEKRRNVSKKKNISHILGDFNIYPDSYPAMSQNKFVGYPCNKMQSNFAPMSIS